MIQHSPISRTVLRDITDWMVPDPDEADDDMAAIVRAMRALVEHSEEASS